MPAVPLGARTAASVRGLDTQDLGATAVADSSTELTIAVLARELEAATRRADEAERFAINFAALAPYARPDELPPLRRFRRITAPRQRTPWAPPASVPYRRTVRDME